MSLFVILTLLSQTKILAYLKTPDKKTGLLSLECGQGLSNF